MRFFMWQVNKGLLFVLVLLFVLTSCESKPDYLIDDDTFAAILADIMVIEKLPVSKEERLKRTQAVFEKFDISPESFAKTKLYHKRDVDFWQRIYQKTMKQLEKKAHEQRDKARPKQKKPATPTKNRLPARKSV